MLFFFSTNAHVGELQYLDIAILTVALAIVYSPAISPVCLPALGSSAVDQFEGQGAAIMGKGNLKFGKAPAFEIWDHFRYFRSTWIRAQYALRQATVKIVTNMPNVNALWYGGKIKSQQFCATT